MSWRVGAWGGARVGCHGCPPLSDALPLRVFGVKGVYRGRGKLSPRLSVLAIEIAHPDAIGAPNDESLRGLLALLGAPWATDQVGRQGCVGVLGFVLAMKSSRMS